MTQLGEASDEEVLAAVAAGPGALAEFYRRHVGRVYGMGVRRFDNPEDVADFVATVFVATVFVEVLASARRFDPDRGRAVAWLYGVGSNVALAMYQQRSRTVRAEQRIAGRSLLDADDHTRIEEAIDAAAELRRTCAAMRKLPERDRRLLELVALDGLYAGQVAAALGLTPVAVRVRLNRARGRLRAVLTQQDTDKTDPTDADPARLVRAARRERSLDMTRERNIDMTTVLEAPEGFEARLLDALTEIDAARPSLATRDGRATARRNRRVVAGVGAAVVVALGGGAAAAATGLFDPAPPEVEQAFGGLDGRGASVESTEAVRIGVIDDHVAYAAPTSSGGFCLYFSDDPARSGPSGGSCLDRGSAQDEAVFSVLWGSDGGILFGRAGTGDAQRVTAAFPRSGDTVDTSVADSGFFAVAIPDDALQSLMATTQPDPGKDVPTKDGAPIEGLQLERIGEIALSALDADGTEVAHGVPVIEPDLAPSPTGGPTP